MESMGVSATSPDFAGGSATPAICPASRTAAAAITGQDIEPSFLRAPDEPLADIGQSVGIRPWPMRSAPPPCETGDTLAMRDIRLGDCATWAAGIAVCSRI